MFASRSRQTLPGALCALATGDRSHPEIESHEGESSRDQNFAADESFLQIVGTDPQQALERDSQCSGLLWVEMVAEVDQCGGFTRRCRCGQSCEHEGKAPTAAATNQLDELTAYQATVEKSIE